MSSRGKDSGEFLACGEFSPSVDAGRGFDNNHQKSELCSWDQGRMVEGVLGRSHPE